MRTQHTHIGYANLGHAPKFWKRCWTKKDGIFCCGLLKPFFRKIFCKFSAMEFEMLPKWKFGILKSLGKEWVLEVRQHLFVQARQGIGGLRCGRRQRGWGGGPRCDQKYHRHDGGGQVVGHPRNGLLRRRILRTSQEIWKSRKSRPFL